MLKTYKLFQTQWLLHKKFKKLLLKIYILNFPTYKSIIFDKSSILFTKLIVFSNNIIKSEYISCFLLHYKKKKFSIFIVENYKKFVLKINLKARNILI